MTRFSLSDRFDPKDPLAVFVFQKGQQLFWDGAAKNCPPAVLQTAKEDGYRGKPGGSFIVRPPEGKPAQRLLLLSAGERDELRPPVFRLLGATAAKRASDVGMKTLNVRLPKASGPLEKNIEAFVEGFLLGSYRYLRHKSSPDKTVMPDEIVFLVPEKRRVSLDAAISQGALYAEMTNYARDLINEPPSLKTPEMLSQKASELAGDRIKVEIFKKDVLAKRGMFALLGVNRGSAHPPALVHLRYVPAGKPKARLALVGKGITFDSGGLSLKASGGMKTMKCDMSGAAAVFAVFHALRRLQPRLEVHGITPLTENMPDGNAYKPGDVLRAANGKTIEVLNTDAEGRLVLADALSFAADLKPDAIVDVATLTGAATVALGKAYTALMSNNDVMTEKIRRASEKSGEKIWRLPLEPSYKEHLHSAVADLKNIGNEGEAGTIIGGLFLQEFVGQTPWVHLDIAATAWTNKATPMAPAGATGVMARTLLRYILAEGGAGR
ncbi:MAG TPA: leucyl aminopeptidase [Elusimicrobiota bacterium]|nr:leucyl aminopeptidase [Elusimicrobiota bacterium]